MPYRDRVKDGLLRRVALLFAYFLALDDLIMDNVSEVDILPDAVGCDRVKVSEEKLELQNIYGANCLYVLLFKVFYLV